MSKSQLPELRYSDPKLRFIEYQAILKILANGNKSVMAQQYPAVHSKISEFEKKFEKSDLDTFKGQALDMLHRGVFDNKLAGQAMMNVYRFMESEGRVVPDGYDDEVIEQDRSSVNIPLLTKAQRNINAEIKKVKRDQRSIARENHQRKRLGNEALVPKSVYEEARSIVFEYLKIGGNREELTQIAQELAVERGLTELQTNTLSQHIMLAYFDKLNIHNRLEFELLANPSQENKSIFYLWHQLCRKYEKGIEFPLSFDQGAKMASCSKSTYPNYIEKMCNLKILKKIAKGKRGANSKMADVYRLLVTVKG